MTGKVSSIQEALEKYFKATSLITLLELNIEFLKNELPSPLTNFSTLQFLDAESEGLEKQLITLNTLGLMTTDSQPGCLEFEPHDLPLYESLYAQIMIDEKKRITNNNNNNSNDNDNNNESLTSSHGGLNEKGERKLKQLYAQTGATFDHCRIAFCQRAYLAAICTVELGSLVVQALNVRDGLMAFIIPNNLKHNQFLGPLLPVTFEGKSSNSVSIEESSDSTNTNTNSSSSSSSIQYQNLKPCTFIGDNLYLKTFQRYLNEELAMSLEESTVTLYVVDTVMGRRAVDYLLPILIQVLTSSTK